MVSRMTVKKTSKKKKTTPARARRLKVGDSVPEFELESTGGRRVSLRGLRGKKVVLYFYPKDATPGCTIEGRDFTRLHNEFKKAGAEVYGISRDDMKSHEKFKSKECYSIDLLSDTESELCRLFDVIKMKNMYGKQVKGIERSTFLIDAAGKLIGEWRGVKVDGHAQAVLDFLR